MALRFHGQSPIAAVGPYTAFPGKIVGAVSGITQQTDMLPLWAFRRNQTAAFGELAGIPDGVNHPGSFLLPLQSGRISARATQVTFTPAATGVQGRPGVGSAAITFTVPAAQLQLVVSTSGSSSVSFTVGGTVAGALLAQGVSAITFTVSAATLGAIINATGSSQVTVSESATLKALGNISGAVTPFTELSPESLAAAVWNALAADYNLVNTMGELLNSGGGGGGGGGGATAAQIWSYVSRTLTASPGPSAATIASQVRTELNTELNRIDANVSSRLASASYTTPPTAAAIRTEIDTNSTKLDVTVGSRLASSSYTAPPSVSAIRTEMDTNSTKLDATISSRALETTAQAIKTKTDALPASPAATGDIPTASQNASAVRTELTTELGRIDATVSSRLASASYTAPPSVSAIRTEMDTNSTKLDVTVGSRLAAASYTAPPSVSAIRTEMDTNSTKLDATISSRALETTAQAIKTKTDNLPASPAATGDVPSAATVASAVRTELTTELGRIDVATSTRLAASAYSAAPSAATVASAVRTELTTELGRIDVAVSTRNSTAPDNASIAAIKVKTDAIPAVPASEATVQATLDAAKLAAALSA